MAFIVLVSFLMVTCKTAFTQDPSLFQQIQYTNPNFNSNFQPFPIDQGLSINNAGAFQSTNNIQTTPNEIFRPPNGATVPLNEIIIPPNGAIIQSNGVKIGEFRGLPSGQIFQGGREFQQPERRQTSFLNNRNEEDEEEDDGTTWKDYFENSVPWPVCETFALRFGIVSKIMPNDVFRTWAIGQICQDILFKVMVPMMSKTMGMDYKAWKF